MCLYRIQPTCSFGFQTPALSGDFPWFSVNAGAERELTPEPSRKIGEILDSQALSLPPSFSREPHLLALAVFLDLEYCFIPSQSAAYVFQLGPDVQHGR